MDDWMARNEALGINPKSYFPFFSWNAKKEPAAYICFLHTYLLDAATLSGILKTKQKLGRTINSDKLGGIAFTKISKLTMCSA